MNKKEQRIENARLLAEKNAATKTQGGATDAPGTEGTNESGTEVATNDNAGEDGEKPKGEGTEVVTGTEGTDAPADAAPDVIVAKIAKKTPPLKNAKRAGGGRTANSGEATYNVGIVAYNELVVDSKTKELKFVPHILNGNWIPTFNGDPAGEIDASLPVFKTLDEALAANAIQFGMKVGEKEMTKLYGYAQNVKLIEGGFPTTGRTDKGGKLLQYSCFITATAKNYEAVVANMKAYLDSPYSAGSRDLFTLLEAPFALTHPVTAPATIGAVKTEETEVAAQD